LPEFAVILGPLQSDRRTLISVTCVAQIEPRPAHAFAEEPENDATPDPEQARQMTLQMNDAQQSASPQANEQMQQGQQPHPRTPAPMPQQGGAASAPRKFNDWAML
jgi:hypothetical protein